MLPIQSHVNRNKLECQLLTERIQKDERSQGFPEKYIQIQPKSTQTPPFFSHSSIFCITVEDTPLRAIDLFHGKVSTSPDSMNDFPCLFSAPILTSLPPISSGASFLPSISLRLRSSLRTSHSIVQFHLSSRFKSKARQSEKKQLSLSALLRACT